MAFSTFLGPMAGAIIGSAIGTLANGGTFKSFAIGVAVGFAAGCIADASGGAMGSTWTDFAKNMAIGAKFVAGAVTGAIAGGISSAIYGQNIGRGMTEGALGGAIGAGVAMAAGHGFSVIKEMMQDLSAGLKSSAHVTFKTIDSQGKVHTYRETWDPRSLDECNPYEKMLHFAINYKEKIIFFEYVGHGLDGNLFYGQSMLGIPQVNSDLNGYKSEIIQVFAKDAMIELEGCYTACSSETVASELKILLPESRVFGYTGKAKAFFFIGCDWESAASGYKTEASGAINQSRWVEVKN